jgi:HD superfamily phosphohydrolase YqeK
MLAWVLLATAVLALLPALIVWWLRERGLVTSYPLLFAVGFAVSMVVARGGESLWRRHPGSQDLLFSDLLVWGYLRRRYTERQLASARALLGAASNAQLRLDAGLSPERQARHLECFARAMDSRDARTHGHSRRVGRYSWMIAKRMGLSGEEVARVRTAAAIHDIGKINTPDSILNKAGSLQDDEYATIKLHAADGALMSACLHDELLTAFIRSHHERLDGSGYPDALHGETIPVGAKIIAVADTFDALTASRPYRTASSHQHALEVLQAEAASKLDAASVKAFLSCYAGRRPLTFWTWLASLPQRLDALLSAGGAGAASAGKALALAAVAGTFAAGAAGLGTVLRVAPVRGSDPSQQTGRSGSGAGAAATATTDVPSQANARANGSSRRNAPRSPDLAQGGRAAASTVAKSFTPGAAAAAAAAASASGGAAGTGAAATSGSGLVVGGGEQSIAGTNQSSSEARSETGKASKGGQGTSAGGASGTALHSEEVVSHPAEHAGGAVTETVTTVAGATKTTVETVGATVETAQKAAGGVTAGVEEAKKVVTKPVEEVVTKLLK